MIRSKLKPTLLIALLRSFPQHSPARKRAPGNSRLGPYRLMTRAKPFRSTRNGPFRRLVLRP
jgi:hypothetical protein